MEHIRAIQQDRAHEVTFMVNGMAINKVSRFKYLGRILDDQDHDSRAAYRQLTRAKDKWRRLSTELKQQGISKSAQLLLQSGSLRNLAIRIRVMDSCRFNIKTLPQLPLKG